jgi:hypothetical protein
MVSLDTKISPLHTTNVFRNRNMVNPRSLTHLYPHPLLLGPKRRCQMHEFCSKMVQRRYNQYPHRFYPLEHPYAVSQRSQSTLPSKSRIDSCVCSWRLVSKPIHHRSARLWYTNQSQSVCLVSIARLGPLYIIATTNDVSLHNGPAAFLSSMEVNVGIICASLPSLRAITLRTCSRRHSHQATSTHHSHSEWWRVGKNDDIELEGGQRQNMCISGSAITKSVSIQMETQERRGSRKSSIWSLGGFSGGIFDGGLAKAHIRSSIQ